MFLFSKDITPETILKADGVVGDMIIKDGKIYATTDNGVVDIYSLDKKTLEKRIEFEKIKDFFGDLTNVKVFSVDKIADELLFVSQGTKGFSRIYLYKNGKKSFCLMKRVLCRQ